MILNKKRLIMFIAFFLITIGNSGFLTILGINNIVEYLGYAILIIHIYIERITIPNEYKKNISIQFIIVWALFSFGIIVQNELSLLIKARLIFSMFILSSLAITSECYIESLKDVKVISYAILFAMVCSTILGAIGGFSLLTYATEGIFSDWGFNGGLQHKNYFAADIIAGFIGIYFYNKFNNNRKKYIIMLLLLFSLLILANSRGALVIFIIFFILANSDKLIKIKKEQRRYLLGFLIILICISGGIYFNSIVSNSGSYLYRLQGLINFFDYYSDSYFYLIFGNAEMAFSDTDVSYNENVRSVLGWDGTTELALLSILIKNGILGLIGYIIIFINIIKCGVKKSKIQNKIMIISLLISFLISGMIETYISNINIVYSAFCYVVMAGLCNIKYD